MISDSKLCVTSVEKSIFLMSCVTRRNLMIQTHELGNKLFERFGHYTFSSPYTLFLVILTYISQYLQKNKVLTKGSINTTNMYLIHMALKCY